MSNTAYSEQSDQQAEPANAVGGEVSSTNEQRRARPVPRISIQVFSEEQPFADMVQEAGNDRRMSKVQMSVQMGGIKTALDVYREGPTPNVIILESLHDRESLLNQLDKLAECCDAGTKVVIVGHFNDVILFRSLMEKGVSEYLVAPIQPLELISAISNLYADPDSEPLGQIFSFIGAKGGVGSSVLSHNVAWAMSEVLEQNVVISDFDLPFGTAGLDFNQDPTQGVADALFDTERMDELMLDRLLAKCSERLSLFASPGSLEREYDVEHQACDLVLDILRKNIPYSVLDIPHAWTSWSKYVLMHSDEIVITASPDLANLRNTKNILDYLNANRQSDFPPRLVLNMVGMPKKPEISIADFTNIVGVKPSIVIDYDAEIFGTAANNGQMIGEVSKKSKVTAQLNELVGLLTDVKQPQEAESSILSPILSRFGVSKGR